MASLLIQSGARKGQVIPLQRPRSVLGRLTECDIVIDGSMVVPSGSRRPSDVISRKHAVIWREGSDYWVLDGDGRASSNATYVNRRRISATTPTRLHDHDLIQMCRFVCTFLHDEADAVAVEASVGPDSSFVALQSHSGERLQTVLGITKDLSRTVDPGKIFDRVLGSLLVLYPQTDRALLLLCDGPDGRPVVRASRHRRPGDPAGDRFSGSVVRQVLGKMEAILGEDLPAQFADSTSILTLPASSLMCSPLWTADNQPLGAVQIETRDPRQKFTRDDLTLFVGVAGQASVAVANARLHQEALENQRRHQDLELARKVQQALLPPAAPDVPGYRFHPVYEPASEVGGDHYDYLPLPDGRLAVLVSDAAGKGAAASLISVKFSVEARAALQAQPDLAAALRQLNEAMARERQAHERFVTLAAVVLDPRAHAAAVVTAGHPAPVLVRAATGEVEPALTGAHGGPPLGAFAGMDFPARRLSLEPGDGLLLYSDGVNEARDPAGRQFHSARVADVLRGRPLAPREAGERLLQAVRAHTAGGTQSDDITIVTLARDPA